MIIDIKRKFIITLDEDELRTLANLLKQTNAQNIPEKEICNYLLELDQYHGMVQ